MITAAFLSYWLVELLDGKVSNSTGQQVAQVECIDSAWIIQSCACESRIHSKPLAACAASLQTTAATASASTTKFLYMFSMQNLFQFMNHCALCTKSPFTSNTTCSAISAAHGPPTAGWSWGLPDAELPGTLIL
jgi:hypothetical protein